MNPSRLPAAERWDRSLKRGGSRTARCRVRPWQQGLSLVEVLIALVLVAIVAGVTSEGSTFLSRRLVAGRQEQLARFLAQEKLAEIEVEPLQSMNRGGEFGDRFPGFSYRYAVMPAQIPKVNASGLFTITMTISWPGGSGREDLQVQTMLTDFSGFRHQGQVR